MKKTTQPIVAESDPNWRNLRDEQGRLYGRVDRVRLLLEVRNHGKTILFDLTRGIEIRAIETKVRK